MGSLTTITEPADEPITLDEAKQALRIEDDDEDTRVWGIIRSARMFAEDFLSLRLMSQTVELSFDRWPATEFSLGVWPIISVDTVKYEDTASPVATQTLVADTDYYADITTTEGRLRTITGWPSVAVKPNAIKIRMTAGYADQDSVPDQIKEGIKAYCAYIYDSDECMKGIAERLLWSARIM